MKFYYGVSSMQVERTKYNWGAKALVYVGLAPGGENKEKTGVKP